MEVASQSTERLDRREKRWAYQTIETLEEYVIISQDHPEVTIFRRANQWNAETLSKMDQSLTLRSVELSLTLASIYAGL